MAGSPNPDTARKRRSSMVFGLIIGKSNDPAVRAERFRLMASGSQLVAIGILLASIISPIFNPTLNAPWWLRLAGGGVAGLIELLALRLLMYTSLIAEDGDE